VEASGDVTVHVVSISDRSTGSYVALPLDKLGTDYYVMTLSSSNETRALWQVSVVSLVDNTVVELSLEARSSRLQPVSVGIDVANIRLQSTATIVLHNYQTFQVICTTMNNMVIPFCISGKCEIIQSSVCCTFLHFIDMAYCAGWMAQW